MANRSKWTEEEWQLLVHAVKRAYARRARRLSHDAIAKEVGCSAQTVRNIVHGFKPRYFRED